MRLKLAREYREIMRLASPIMLANVGQIVVQLADTIMVGRLGADALAAAAFGGFVIWNILILGQGFSIGLTPLIGENFARGEYRKTSFYFQNSLLLNLVISFVIMAIMAVVYLFLGNMGQDPAVVELSRGYYIYLALSTLPFMAFFTFKQFMEGVGNTKVSMVITIVANLANIFMNWLFIYGNWGVPAMGVAGAGLATLISRLMMPLMYGLFFMRRDSFKRYFAFFNREAFDRIRLRKLSSVGLPVATQMFMEVSAFSLSTIMMGWLGAISLAANQIACSMCNLSFMVVMGIAQATTIVVSHCSGTNNYHQLDRYTSASYRLMWGIEIIASVLFIVFRTSIASLFNTDPEVVRVASTLMIFAGIFQISDGTQAVTLGMLRGLKDVRRPMIYAFVAYLVLNLPIGYLLAFVLKLGAPGIWLGFIVGLSTAAILFRIRFKSILKLHKLLNHEIR